MRFDCIVMGAGPAGSTAGRVLAGKGVSVAILDKARFPRAKPCGGGLTNRTIREIGVDLDAAALNETRSVRAVITPTRTVALDAGEVLVRFVDRKSFDLCILRKAENTGALIHQGVSVHRIAYNGEHFCVQTDRGAFRSPFLIGADGSESMVTRRFGIVDRKEHGTGITVTVPMEMFDREPSMTFDFSAVPGGYGWVFPGRETASIGLYTTGSRFRGLPALLDRFLESTGCPLHEGLQRKAHILPFWGVNYRQPRLPVVLTGDAAGFVDPLSGEGVFFAVKSARIAAECVSKWIKDGRFSPEDIQKRYDHEVINTLRAGRRLGNAFYKRRFPVYQLMTSGPGLKALCLAFLKGEDYPNMWKKLPQYVIDLSVKKQIGTWYENP